MKDLDFNNYTAYFLKDEYDDKVCHNVIMLHNKHTVQEFQTEIDKVKVLTREEREVYGDDWQVIINNISEEFDWVDLRVGSESLYF